MNWSPVDVNSSGPTGSYMPRYGPDPAPPGYMPPPLYTNSDGTPIYFGPSQAPPGYMPPYPNRPSTGYTQEPHNPDALWWAGKPKVDISGTIPPFPDLSQCPPCSLPQRTPQPYSDSVNNYPSYMG